MLSFSRPLTQQRSHFEAAQQHYSGSSWGLQVFCSRVPQGFTLQKLCMLQFLTFKALLESLIKCLVKTSTLVKSSDKICNTQIWMTSWSLCLKKEQHLIRITEIVNCPNVRYHGRLLACSAVLDSPVIYRICPIQRERLKTGNWRWISEMFFSVTKLLFCSSWVDMCKTKSIYRARCLPPQIQKMETHLVWHILPSGPFHQKEPLYG